MVRVQRFADETAEEAQHKARTMIANAQLEAASIVSRARREAEEIAAQSAPPGCSRSDHEPVFGY